MQARTGLSREDKRSLYKAFWKQAQRSNEWHRAFSLRLHVEAVWAEAISQGLLCVEGAPGLCLPHLKTHHWLCTTLALWLVPAYSTKKPLLSVVRKLYLSYRFQIGLTRRNPRPRPMEGPAGESTGKHKAFCAKGGCFLSCLNFEGLSLAEHKVGGP